jgi:hypothetical protein
MAKTRYDDMKNFVKFAKLQLVTEDIDPQFCLLRSYYNHAGVQKKNRLWLTLLYLTWYHFGSAEKMWRLYPEQRIIKKTHVLPTGKNRRLFRGTNRAVEYLNSITETIGDINKWTDNQVRSGGKSGWTRARMSFEAIHCNGPWSSYKWCDMLKFVHEYPITAPDIGDKKGVGAGPIAGLSSLTKLSWNECSDSKVAIKLYRDCKHKFGVPLNGLDQLESILCNWQGVVRGRYYVGHDIDRDQEQLLENSELWSVRSKVYKKHTLGEHNGWHGVRKHIKPLYRERGIIHDPFKEISIKKTTSNS